MTHLVLVSLCVAAALHQPSAVPTPYCDRTVKNYYSMLRISANATPKEISTTCQRLKSAFDPGVWTCGERTQASQLSKVEKACHVLMDEDLKLLHDSSLPEACPGQKPIDDNCEICKKCRTSTLSKWWRKARWLILVIPVYIPAAVLSWVPVALASIASIAVLLVQQSPWLARVFATLAPYVAPIANLVRLGTTYANQWFNAHGRRALVGFVLVVLLPTACRIVRDIWAATLAYRVAITAAIANAGAVAQTHSLFALAYLLQGLCWVVVQLGLVLTELLKMIRKALGWVITMLNKAARFLNVKANQWSGGAIPIDPNL